MGQIKIGALLKKYVPEPGEIVASVSPEIRTIDNYAFSNCMALKTVLLPDTLQTIEDRSFARCTSLLMLEIPDSLVKIGSGAFADCTALKEIDLSRCRSLTIGPRAFSGCTSLEKITVADSVVIGQDAFSGCTALRSICCTDADGGCSEFGKEAFGSYFTKIPDVFFGKTSYRYYDIIEEMYWIALVSCGYGKGEKYVKRNIDSYLERFLLHQRYADLRFLIGHKLVTPLRFDRTLAELSDRKAFQYITAERALPEALVLLHKQCTATLTILIEKDDFDSFKWFVDHGFVTKKNLGEILEATIALERPTYRPMLLALREETISPDEGKLRL